MSVATLNEHRANLSNDNSLWTPEECGAAFVRDVRTGAIKPKRVIILYEEESPDGGAVIATYLANVPRDYEIVMLHMRLHFATHKWER